MFLLSDLDPRVRTLGYMVKLFAKVGYHSYFSLNFLGFVFKFFPLHFGFSRMLSFVFQVCDIGDASRGSLSSYAYILMMIFYLQVKILNIDGNIKFKTRNYDGIQSMI